MTILKIKQVAVLLMAILLLGCSASKKLERNLERAAAKNNYFTGVTVINASTGKRVLDLLGDKYFTPASNVKLFTLYAALKTLGDSVPSFEYRRSEDSLIIKGTADPMFLNDSLHDRSVLFLRNSDARIYLVDESLDDDVYGPGWSWEDYAMGYMPEKSLFPLYGNTVSISKKGDSLEVTPSFFYERTRLADEPENIREQGNNTFFVPVDAAVFDREIPFKTSNQLAADLLSQELGVKVTLVPETHKGIYKTFRDMPYDSLYTRMIKDSDNFIAEQLMLRVSRKITGSYDSAEGIQHILDRNLIAIPQKPRWVDGSGLSRYNLFSPRSIVYILQRLYLEFPKEKLFSYFPQGGEDGTLNGHFKGQPYISAKSGTLSNNYCLSGYLTTKKGSVLIFSYMNNHYQGSSTERKKEMAGFFKQLYEKY